MLPVMHATHVCISPDLPVCLVKGYGWVAGPKLGTVGNAFKINRSILWPETVKTELFVDESHSVVEDYLLQYK